MDEALVEAILIVASLAFAVIFGSYTYMILQYHQYNVEQLYIKNIGKELEITMINIGKYGFSLNQSNIYLGLTSPISTERVTETIVLSENVVLNITESSCTVCSTSNVCYTVNSRDIEKFLDLEHIRNTYGYSTISVKFTTNLDKSIVTDKIDITFHVLYNRTSKELIYVYNITTG